MNKSPIGAVIWDMDGVIADTASQHYQSWVFAFKNHGVVFSEEDFKHHFGQRNDIIITDAMGGNASAQLIDAISSEKENYYRENAVGHTTAFPGVVELLKRLDRLKIVSAVASSAPIENVRLILRELKIEQYFHAVVYGLEVTEGKPSPQAFLLAARKLGVEPENCVVVEDAVAGVTAAKSAGMKCIAVTNTHESKYLLHADMIVSTLELVGIDDIKKLFGF
jgi:beta-phosphoglucomutase family hydrolase